MHFFFQDVIANPQLLVPVVLLIAFSICLHEYAHARTALWQGDDTAAVLGHLTLNPLKQMGWISLVMLALIGIAWGAVPVDPRRMKGKHSPAIVAAAGPLTNLGLFIVFAALGTGLAYAGLHDGAFAHWELFATILRLAAIMNGALFLLNIVPCYPLDGWAIVSNFFPLRRINPELMGAFSLVLLIILFQFSEYLFVLPVWVLQHIEQWIL